MTDKLVKCIFMIKFSIKDRSIQNEIQVLFYFLEIDFLYLISLIKVHFCHRFTHGFLIFKGIRDTASLNSRISQILNCFQQFVQLNLIKNNE